MKKRDVVFVFLGTLFAITTISLGFWQLARLKERRTFNKELLSRAETAPVPLSLVPGDTGKAHFRRVKLEGTYDFEHEIIVTNRTRNGSPGVNIITPLKVPGTQRAVLINRGWIYAPDAMTADLSKWREADTLVGDGYVENFQTRPGNVKSATRPRAFRWLDRTAISQAFPYAIAPYYVVLIDDGKKAANVPPRLNVPPLDEGPHKSYALQWFSFATISIIGMFLFVRRK
jgi:surfeit locus 1 family protein